jgi:hypothetical protein
VEQLLEARGDLDVFSSVNCIAAKHEAQSLEAAHEFFHLARYMNSVTGKSNCVVLYGLELQQVKFMETLRSRLESLPVRILALEYR